MEEDTKSMKVDVKNVKEEFKAATLKTAYLTQQLKTASAKLEKLKATLGKASSLHAFLQLNEAVVDEGWQDDLLQPGMVLVCTL